MLLQDLNLFSPFLAHPHPVFDWHFLAALNDLQTESTATTATDPEPTQDLDLALPFRVHEHPAVRHVRAFLTAAHTGVGGAVGVAVGAGAGAGAVVGGAAVGAAYKHLDIGSAVRNASITATGAPLDRNFWMQVFCGPSVIVLTRSLSVVGKHVRVSFGMYLAKM